MGFPSGGPVPTTLLHSNPLSITTVNPDVVWEHVVDVVDDYFRIRSERRVQVVGDVVTEGQIDTFPQGGATYLEPHLLDSFGPFNRWESTLQTIRRQAQVRVIPAPTGFLVEVIVDKELENLPRPEHATSGAATFRNDSAPKGRSLAEAGSGGGAEEWIPQGRDLALEQRILSEIHARLGGVSPGVAYY